MRIDFGICVNRLDGPRDRFLGFVAILKPIGGLVIILRPKLYVRALKYSQPFRSPSWLKDCIAP